LPFAGVSSQNSWKVMEVPHHEHMDMAEMKALAKSHVYGQVLPRTWKSWQSLVPDVQMFVY